MLSLIVYVTHTLTQQKQEQKKPYVIKSLIEFETLEIKSKFKWNVNRSAQVNIELYAVELSTVSCAAGL